MDEFHCHPGRTFTLEDHAEALRKNMIRKPANAWPVSDINLNPISEPVELKYLAGLSQFHRISNKVLFKLVRVAAGIEVRDRWVAIRTILIRRIPIPVAKPLSKVRHG
jgi:hypothetical protein